MSRNEQSHGWYRLNRSNTREPIRSRTLFWVDMPKTYTVVDVIKKYDIFGNIEEVHLFEANGGLHASIVFKHRSSRDNALNQCKNTVLSFQNYSDTNSYHNNHNKQKTTHGLNNGKNGNNGYDGDRNTSNHRIDKPREKITANDNENTNGVRNVINGVDG